jgi:inward rectifier potassium channel
MATPPRTTEGEVIVLGAASHLLRDAYHSLLRMRWSGLLSAIAASYLLVNALFAIGYLGVGGVEGMKSHSFGDAFFFSVQTLGTIGYGSMYPITTSANLLMVAESVVGLIMTALATGIVFARFSKPRGSLVFSQNACISPMNGVPTLMFRIGNDRASKIFEARVLVTHTRTERTHEGVLFYRLTDLKLVRDQSPALSRSFMILHVLDEASPLYGTSPESCLRDEVELLVTVVGTDDLSLQPVHAQHRYDTKEIVWGARLADVLSELPDGRLQLDLRRFHDLVRSEPTATFPWPKA